MNISEILAGTVTNLSVDEQREVLEQMKESKIFDLTEAERAILIDFICDKTDSELAVDYLFHVLDNEISYPIDDEKVKSLFSDPRMVKLKDLMMEKLQEGEEFLDEISEESSESSEETDS